jgi:hypothetical protein
MNQNQNGRTTQKATAPDAARGLRPLIGWRSFSLVYRGVECEPILEIKFYPESLVEILSKAFSDFENIDAFIDTLQMGLVCLMKTDKQGQGPKGLMVGPTLQGCLAPVKLPLEGTVTEAVAENEETRKVAAGYQFVSINLPTQLADMMHRLLVGAIASSLPYEITQGVLKEITADSVNTLKPFLPLRRKGWQKKPAAPRSESRRTEFVELVKKRYELGDLIQKTFKAQKNGDWKKALKKSKEYRIFSQGCDQRVIEDVLKLIPSRFRRGGKSARAYKEGTRPLAIAAEIAARELDFTDSSGKWYKPSALITEFNKAGGRIRN